MQNVKYNFKKHHVSSAKRAMDMLIVKYYEV